MKLNERIGALIKEVENARYPEDKDAYKRICEYVSEFKKHIQAVYALAETLKELDNRQTMMYCYLPKSNTYDAYGSRSAPNDEWNYMKLANEKKKLIRVMYKLKAKLEGLERIN